MILSLLWMGFPNRLANSVPICDRATQLEVTSARPHDSQHIGDVLTGEETALYADSAYGSAEYRETLQELDIEDHILEKAQKNKALTNEQRTSNRTKSRIRSRVEHIFGHWKVRHGFEQVRYNNLRANRLDAFFHAIAHNLRRGLFLSKNGLYTRPCSV
jgi:transposase, IS5 family